ncbi:MAG: membrane protein insertion efficiency factor YidD [Patescibacteria group bacterium]
MRRFLIAAIELYQATLSPDHGPRRRLYPNGFCRFSPSCSAYAITAIRQYGAIAGTWLALKRLVRCHPWSAGGLDLVPRP